MADKIKYHCTYCEYRFVRTADIQFKQCPYCGRTGTVEVDTQDKASKLIKEVSGYSRPKP
jgi:hypothetical protein